MTQTEFDSDIDNDFKETVKEIEDNRHINGSQVYPLQIDISEEFIKKEYRSTKQAVLYYSTINADKENQPLAISMSQVLCLVF